MRAAAAAPSAAETPGTTSNGTPAAASSSPSSPPRPNTNGSPALSRTTLFPALARSSTAGWSFSGSRAGPRRRGRPSPGAPTSPRGSRLALLAGGAEGVPELRRIEPRVGEGVRGERRAHEHHRGRADAVRARQRGEIRDAAADHLLVGPARAMDDRGWAVCAVRRDERGHRVVEELGGEEECELA